MRYRADVDGLRALAVLPVLLFHGGVPPFQGGFVGVDVFFVISGFLITGMIVEEAERGRFSILRFYERRARRILPALIAMIALIAAPVSILLIPETLKSFGASAAAAALSVSNLFFWREAGYFDLSAAQAPLLHTWSLGVEEQFYIFFPIYLMLMRRITNWSWVRIIAAIAVLSLIIGIVLVRFSEKAAFYLPMGRMWELALGGLIAVGAAPRIDNRAANEAIALAGLALLCVSIFTFSEATLFPGEAALVPCLGAAMMIYANREQTFVGRALAWPPLVFVGLISYSLYLWHWPLLVLGSSFWARQPDLPQALALLALSFVIATLSWRFIETPVRRRMVFKTRPAVFAAAGAGVACVTAFGALVWIGQGWPQRYAQPMRTFALASYDINPDRAACVNRSPRVVREGAVCRIGVSGVQPSFAVIGDSFADALAPGVDAAAREHGVSGLVLIQTGCMPLVGVETGGPCDAFLSAVEARLQREPNLRSIVLIARWSAFVEGSRFGAIRRPPSFLRDAETQKLSADENERVVMRGFIRTLDAMSDRALYVVAFLPEQPVLAPQAATTRALLGEDPSPGVVRAAFDQRQRRMHAILSDPALTRIHVIDASRVLCTARDCPIVMNGVPFYFDDNHVSRTGAIRIRSMFAPAIAGVQVADAR